MTATILVVDDEPGLALLVTHKYRRQIREGEYNFLLAGEKGVAIAFNEKQKRPDQKIVAPPSTSITCPVVEDDSSEARYSAM